MNLKSLTGAVTRRAGRQIMLAKKNSPVVMFGVGIASFAATIYFSNKATLKLDDVLKVAEDVNQKIDEELTDNGAISSSGSNADEFAKKKITLRVQTAIKVAKLYAPAVGFGVLSVACLTGSHVVLTKRNAGLTAAYALLDKGYREFQQRVRDEFGDEKADELRHGLVPKEVAVETDQGITTKTEMAVSPNGLSMYAKCFDETNINWERTHHANQTFIMVQQNFANDKLRAQGFLLLNDVYEMLGIDKTPAGCVVGWVLGNGDDNVDFGVFRGNVAKGNQFALGQERSVWLDFNVDGVVYDLIGK